MRPSGRAPDQMRQLTFEPGFTRHAEGACLVSFGETRVLCTASVEDKVPPFLRGKGQGWVTAEYGMLPRATHTRGNREAAEGKAVGAHAGDPAAHRTLASRRGRPRPKLGERRNHRRLRRDPGGWRHAHGIRCRAPGCALRIAMDKLLEGRRLRRIRSDASCRGQLRNPPRECGARTSIMRKTVRPAADGNFVLTADGAIVEAQVTAEGECYDEEGLLRRFAWRGSAAPRFPSPAQGDRTVRPSATSSSSRPTMPGKLREIAALIEPLGINCRCPGVGPAGTRGDRE